MATAALIKSSVVFALIRYILIWFRNFTISFQIFLKIIFRWWCSASYDFEILPIKKKIAANIISSRHQILRSTYYFSKFLEDMASKWTKQRTEIHAASNVISGVHSMTSRLPSPLNQVEQNGCPRPFNGWWPSENLEINIKIANWILNKLNYPD